MFQKMLQGGGGGNEWNLIADSGEFSSFPNTNAKFDFENSTYSEYLVEAMFAQSSGEGWMSAFLYLPASAVNLATAPEQYEIYPNIFQSSSYNGSFSINFWKDYAYVRTVVASGWHFNNYRLKVYAR